MLESSYNQNKKFAYDEKKLPIHLDSKWFWCRTLFVCLCRFGGWVGVCVCVCVPCCLLVFVLVYLCVGDIPITSVLNREHPIHLIVLYTSNSRMILLEACHQWKTFLFLEVWLEFSVAWVEVKCNEMSAKMSYKYLLNSHRSLEIGMRVLNNCFARIFGFL